MPASVLDGSVASVPGSDVKCVKSWGVVQNTPENVHRQLWSETKEEKLRDDDTMIDHKIVEVLDDAGNYQIVYQKYKFPWPLSARDFVFLRFVRTLPDGTIVFISKSVTHPDYPEEKKTVRGDIINSAYVQKPQDGNTLFGYMVQMDPKVPLPSSLPS